MDKNKYSELVKKSKAISNKWRSLPAPQRGEYIRLFGDGINYKKQVKILGLHSGKNISNYEASKLVKNYCSNLKNFS